MVRKFTGLGAILALASLAIYSGCQSENSSPPDGGASRQSNASASPAPQGQHAGGAQHPEEHAHEPGAHGGLIVPIGRDSYHAEAVFEKGGALRLFMLGQDEGRVQEVELQTLTAYVKPAGGNDAVTITLEAQPQTGDAESKTSLFVGQVPEDLAGRAVEVTIPSLRIGGERFRLGFESAQEPHDDEHMPEKTTDAAEAALYLTPGGKYTAADIAANGNVTASVKFRGVKARHDLNPKPGDKICPITLTKANPDFTWVVDGKPYEFCCPPCVDEFVRAAKEGGEIKDPEDYVKK